jgi:transcriptional regulator with XRE-family HTH domain
MSFTAAQCRAARALIGWSQDQLADASKVAKATIANFELGKRDPYPRTLDDIRGALESMGVEFTNGGNPGVRIKWPIVLALKILARYVTQHVDIMVSSGGKLPSIEERADRETKVERLCSELMELADRSRQGGVNYEDFEIILRKLHALGAMPTNEQVSAVAHAFPQDGMP